MAQLDLAPIGNCAIASLIDTVARHVWFCFPRLDGDPVFNALVGGEDPKTGFMDVTVEGYKASRQSYLRNTAVLETILSTEAGEELRILDFVPRFRQFGRSFHPPMLVRRLEPLKGIPRITVRVRPTFDYGQTVPQVSIGSNHLRYTGDRIVLRVTTDIGPTYILNESPFLLHGPANIFIGSDEHIPEEPDGLAQRFLHETTNYWVDWARQLAIPFEWQQAVIRAAITLKLCSFEETGAIVAALTTSIPEAPNTARNWDYRYCWLRDSYFTVSALNRLGVTRTMENYVRFLLDTVVREHDNALRPLYPIVASTDLAEYESPALKGYRGMGPVRVGNAAFGQRQNDVYGSVILSSAQIFWDSRIQSIGGIDLYRRLQPLGKSALQDALVPDAGVWEYRNRSSIFTHSATMCWAAVHQLALIAQKVGALDDVAHWNKTSNVLQQQILDRAVTSGGWISGTLDGEAIDASVLLLPKLGLLPATDERFLQTLKMVEKRLLRNGFLQRYCEADDFGEPESAFLVCTFWYIDALVAVGRRDEARELFVNIMTYRNKAGLLSEDIDPGTGVLWGNFPQTYSLVGLTLSAHSLSRTWEQGLWYGK